MVSTSSTRVVTILTKSMNGMQPASVLDSTGIAQQYDSIHGFEFRMRLGLPSIGS